MDIERMIEASIPFLMVTLGLCVISALYGLYLVVMAQGNPKMRASGLNFGYGGIYMGFLMAMLTVFFANFPQA